VLHAIVAGAKGAQQKQGGQNAEAGPNHDLNVAAVSEAGPPGLRPLAPLGPSLPLRCKATNCHNRSRHTDFRTTYEGPVS
jgi:hypothetical protein